MKTLRNIPKLCYSTIQQKGGLDRGTKMLRSYSAKAAFQNKHLAVFSNILDIVSLNAYIISNNAVIQDLSRRTFLLWLWETLSGAEWQRRNKSGSRFEAVVNQSGATDLQGNRLPFCGQCQENKTSVRCSKLKIYVCVTYSHHVCLSCLSESQ